MGIFRRKRRKTPASGRQSSKYTYLSETPTISNAAKEEKRGWFNRFIRFLVAAALIFLVFYFSSFNGSYELNLYTPGTSTKSVLRSEQDYELAVKEILNSNVLNRVKLTMNTSHIEQQIKAEFPELSDVSVSVPILARQPVISLTSSELVFLYVKDNHIYGLNSDGYASVDQKSFPNISNIGLKPVLDQSTGSAQQGTQVLASSHTQYLIEVERQLEQAGIKTESYTLPESPLAMDLKIQNTPYIVRFSFETDARQSAGALIALKQKLDSSGVTPKEYIDVRLSEKTYYR